MSTKRNRPRFDITVDSDVATKIDNVAKRRKQTRSRVVNEILKDAISMGALGEELAVPRWDHRHLQVVLDLAHTVAEVKDLVYTVLSRGWPLDFDSEIGWSSPYLRELKAAVEARLTELRSLAQPPAPPKEPKKP